MAASEWWDSISSWIYGIFAIALALFGLLAWCVGGRQGSSHASLPPRREQAHSTCTPARSQACTRLSASRTFTHAHVRSLPAHWWGGNACNVQRGAMFSAVGMLTPIALQNAHGLHHPRLPRPRPPNRAARRGDLKMQRKPPLTSSYAHPRPLATACPLLRTAAPHALSLLFMPPAPA